MALRKKEERMTRTERRTRRSAMPGRDAFFFLMTFLGTLLLGLPGWWCLLAAGLTVVFFLLFLHSTRGGCPQAPASQIHPRPIASIHAPFPHRDAC
jgi:hypothetical protein